MTGASPPRWDEERLEADRLKALAAFRDERWLEPIELYVEQVERFQGTVEDLLELTVDLSELEARALDVLTDGDLLTAVRYLPGPPVSEDDLKLLSEGTLAKRTLKSNPEMRQQIVRTILGSLDRQRFPWVAEARDPTDEERAAAVLATAAMIASRKVMTQRANEAKAIQEESVKQVLRDAGLAEVSPRHIANQRLAPRAGEFCGEARVGDRKADVVVGLFDGRFMPVECKVSNSFLNSVKRLNNDSAAKAREWLGQFGTANVVPSAVLSGAFKRHNLV